MRTIKVILTEQELQEILHENKKIYWAEKTFDIEISKGEQK